MKHLLVTSLVALGFFSSGLALAATTLSDAELAEVSGGRIDPHLEGQNLPQEQQQPESNNSGYTPLRQPESIYGMELAPELFSILQSRIDVERERKLLLNGTTQQNAIGFNLENALSSDIVSTNNIFNGDSITLDDVTSGIEVNQVNDLSQRHRTQGKLTSSNANHRYEKSELRRSGSESYNYHAYSLVDRRTINEYESTSTRGNHVKVGDQDRYTKLKDIPTNIITQGQKTLLDLLDFRVDEINFGVGFASKGSGTINADPARFWIGAEANVEACFFIWCWEITIARFNVDKEFIVMGNVVIENGDVGDIVETADRDDNLAEEYKAIDVAESTFNESYEHTVFTGGHMSGAEAELLALSEGTLSVDNNSTVSLASGAQQNMRVFNGVNAVSSIAANSLNISRTSSLSARPSGVPQLSLKQQNRFNQEM